MMGYVMNNVHGDKKLAKEKCIRDVGDVAAKD
jgi:hypothetical protein